jgi:NADH-quinone oxidoreductase subunit C
MRIAPALVERLQERFEDVLVARDEATVTIPSSDVLPTLRALRDDPALSFGWLSGVTCTDWPDRDPRFWLAYHLRSLEHGHRVRVKAGLPAETPRVASVTPMFPTANWHEREVFDMFGVTFDGHPDLRRILMPSDWDGHPLRKDYGLGGVNVPFKGAHIPPPDLRSY